MFCFIFFRTAKDIQVLEGYEIPPARTEFVKELGRGAFGKVHKAKLTDGLDYLKNEEAQVNKSTKKEIVAVKELHGKWKLFLARDC